jgi:threonine/homoserine/homoserine lactone efflux protein
VPVIVAGDLTANAGQMAVVGGLLAAFEGLQTSIPLGSLKWLGVAYLLALACRRLLGAKPDVPRLATLSGFSRGFLVSATNPKALVFFAGLFPAFLRPEAPLIRQILILGLVYLVLDGVCLGGYALAADRLRRSWSQTSGRGLDRLAGVLFLAAASFLALK